MKRLLTGLILIIFTGITLAQNINRDVLTQNYVKSYISLLDKKYLPARKKIIIPKEISAELKHLQNQYNARLEILFPATPTERNAVKQAVRNYYTYYPDVAAIFTNRNNQFETTITEEEKSKYNNLLVNLWKKIPNPLFEKVSAITDNIRKGKVQLTVPYHYDFYRNFNDDNLRKRDDVINFLLWNLDNESTF